jgi:hypothetical protein
MSTTREGCDVSLQAMDLDSGDWGAIASGVSAVVALMSALAAGAAAIFSRRARDQADARATDALQSAQSVAIDIGVIATIQEAQRAADVDKQAHLVYLAKSDFNGRAGYVVMNASDAPISRLQVSSRNATVVHVYGNNGDDMVHVYQEDVLGPRASSRTFIPHARIVPHPPEIEQIGFIFDDARGIRWGRFGTQKPTRLGD